MQCRRWFALLVCCTELCAQELVTTYHRYAPEQKTARLHRGFGSSDDERAWVVVLGLSLPLARLQDSLWLLGVASHLLQANALNDIGFNPRSARWEEQLLVLWKRSPWSFYGGLLHFCKHEIDNADPPDTDEPVAGYQPTKRVIILHGPFAGVRYWQRWFSWWHNSAELRAFLFLIAQDYRVRGDDRLRWSRLRASFQLHLTAQWAAWGFGQVMLRAALFRSPSVVQWEYRVELGSVILQLPIALFVYGERLFDDLARPFPHPSHSVGVGLRWMAGG